MATNDFLVFGGGAGANVITQVTYSGLAARTAGFSAGVAQSAQLNKVWRQSSIMSAVLGQFIADQTGQDALDDGTISTLLANLGGAVTSLVKGAYGLRGLTGNNNTTTPNTKYDVAADVVVLRNPTNGSLATRTTTGSITCDLTVAGPAANGRDQAGAFSASTWLHFYFIWNGTALATIASTAAPPTGPTLPTGYTHWAYIGAIYFNASSQLVKTRIRGATAYYDAKQNALSGAGNTTETSVSLTTLVPPESEEIRLNINVGLATASSGTAGSNLFLRVVSGLDFAHITNSVGVANQTAWNSESISIPNVGQGLFFLFGNETSPGNIFSRQAYIDVIGYTLPNGG